MKKLLLLVLLFPLFLNAGAQCVTTIVVSNNACGGNCSGVVYMQFSGGAMPLSLTVTDPFSQQMGPFTVTTGWQFGNLCPGNYDVLVTDANGDTCIGNNNFQIMSFPEPDATVTVTNASCSLCSDGAATVSVTGGTPPYTYLISTGSTTPNAMNLSPGTYTAWVTDANGCSDIDTFLVGIGANGNFPLSGTVYYDINSNGIKDAGDPGMANQQVGLIPGNVTAFTNPQGDYAIAAVPGTYDVTMITAPGWNLTSTPASYNVILSAPVGNLDFGLFPVATTGQATNSFGSGWPRCFWDVPYYLTVYNSGFTLVDGGVTMTYDPALTYVSSTIAPSSHVGNVITFTFSGLTPSQFFQPVVTFTLPAGGTILNSTVTAIVSDAFGYQDTLNTVLTQTVTCSYDPNDKAVLPAGLGTGNYVAMDTWLDYRIRFQNTGTDTAFMVVILDTLDAGLDLSTFTLMGASHQVDATIAPGNAVAFTFDNIFLPDSNVNEPASHGYVLFRIKGNSLNPDPTIVNNTAYIYFDLNSPVITNTTLTTFSDNWLSVSDAPDGNEFFEVFPNPAEDVAIIRLKQPSAVEYSITITDVSGRIVSGPSKMVNGSLLIEMDGLQSGTYLLGAQSSKNEPAIYYRLIKK